MSILELIKNQFKIKPTAKEFYNNSEVKKINWWLSYCHEYPEFYWARLRTFFNGKADVLFEDEYIIYGFDNNEFAGYFISEDEFIEFDENFDEEDKKFIVVPKDFIIELPDWAEREVEDFKYIGKY